MNKNVVTIRRKTLLPIIFVIFAALCGFGFIACSEDTVTEDDVIAKGYKIGVVFDYGGGTVNEKSEMKIRIKENTKIPNPASQGNKLNLPGRVGYSFSHYCVAKTDENGELIKDDDGKLIPDKVWDFDNDIPTGDVTLIAQWWQNYKLVLHYGNDHSETKTTEIPRNEDGSPTTVIKSSFLVADYTFIDYFYDEDGTEIIESVPMPLENERFLSSSDGLTLDVWGTTLKGTYQVIKEAKDFLSFSFSPATNIYMYDSVDMNELTENQSLTFPNEYNGEFLGNGKTISNLKTTKTATGSNDYYCGIFNQINSDAKISNITFKDVILTADLAQPSINQYTLGLFAGRVRENAELTDINVSGTIDYTIAAGFTDFDHLTVNDFIGSDQGAKKTDCVSVTSVIASKAFFTENGEYAVYAKYTEDGDDITVGEVYGIASKSGNAYNAIRSRGDVEVEDDTYKFPAANNVYYFITLNQASSDITAEVVRTLAVYSTDANKQYEVYFEYAQDDSLTDIFAMASKTDGTAYETVAIDGEISYNESNSTYTVTAEGGDVYNIVLKDSGSGRNRYSVEVTKQ